MIPSAIYPQDMQVYYICTKANIQYFPGQSQDTESFKICILRRFYPAHLPSLYVFPALFVHCPSHLLLYLKEGIL